MNYDWFSQKARSVRKQALEMTVSAGKGHLGGAFSCVEILVALYYGGIFRISPIDAQKALKDHFIFSKGHACLALYPILADLGFFSSDALATYGQNGSMLGGHPDHMIPGIELSTGSLGHGLNVACGLALGAKMDQKDSVAIALIGDGECNEGSVWEAAIFAASRELDNLAAIIDNNKISATTFTANFFNGSRMAEKWHSFGWAATVIDGHDFEQLFYAYKNVRANNMRKPTVIIAETIKGKGISFMENRPEWHHGVPQGELLALARKELE